MRLVKLMAIFFMLANPAAAQYFSTGEEPASVRWTEINTRNFQLIFPRDYRPQAVRLACMLEKVYVYGSRTLGYSPRKISVILHTRTVVSNGLVAWAPRRAEFYTAPDQKIYPQDWLEQLAIHEFRHVVQMDKLESELPLLLKALFGQQAAAMVAGLYLPFWFIEGDAVMAETALSEAGRGRLPFFLMQHKAQVAEKGVFSYDKAVLGSFADYVPDHYRLGYLLAGAIREKYGAGIWEEVIREVGRKPFSVNPVNRVLKAKTGAGKEGLYAAVFNGYARQWSSERASLPITPCRDISPEKHDYVNYRYVHALSDSSFIALRSARKDIDRIVLVANGKETIITTPGIVLEESLSARKNLIIWAELRADLRWEHARRSVVVVFDRTSRERKEFRTEYNLHSPVIAPDMKSFAGIENNFTNGCSLVQYDLESGQKTATCKAPENQYFFTPAWHSNNQTIFFVGLDQKGKYIGALDTRTGEISTVVGSSRTDIRNPLFRNGNLYYTSSLTGTDNIFCKSLNTGETTQITSVPFGADYVSAADSSLLFSNYFSDGYRVSEQKISPETKSQPAGPARYELADALARQESRMPELSDVQDTTAYRIRPYRKMAHLFHFHSWGPLYVNASGYEIRPGVSFLSQNKLGTASTLLGYEYEPSAGTGKVRFDFEYSGLFPVLKSEFSYGRRKSVYYILSNAGRDTVAQGYSRRELNWSLDVRLPLIFSRGKYTRLLVPAVEYRFEKIMQDSSTRAQIPGGHIHSLRYGMLFQNMLRKAELDLVPAWGQSLSLLYSHSPGGGWPVNDLAAAELSLFFPGIVKNHGIRIYSGFQLKGTDHLYTFSDEVRFPRGSVSVQNKQLFSFAADYLMPLAYPDLALGRMFYLKRLRTNLFGDYAQAKSVLYGSNHSVLGTIGKNFSSVGLELMADGHLLRLVTPVSCGVRGIYRPEMKDYVLEFLLSVSFDQL